jgi:hypothetical protein
MATTIQHKQSVILNAKRKSVVREQQDVNVWRKAFGLHSTVHISIYVLTNLYAAYIRGCENAYSRSSGTKLPLQACY